MCPFRKNIQPDSKKGDKKCLISTHIATILLLFGIGLAANCTNPISPLELEQFEIDGYTWTYLGLEDKWVTAVEDTTWGLFAGTRENGVFRFDDETNRWTSLGLDHAPISDIVFAGSDEHRLLVGVRCCIEGQKPTTRAAVFASFDQGNSWLEWDDGIGKNQDGNLWAFSLVVDDQNPDRVFFGQHVPQLFKSEDGGLSWDFISGSFSESGSGTEFITISPHQDGRIWFGGQTAFSSPIILRSDDWGRDAEVIFIPQTGGSAGTVIVDEQNPDLLWRAGGGSIRISTDGGDTWNTIFIPEVPPQKQFVRFTGGIILHSETLFTAGVLEESATKFENLEWTLFASNDKGETWHTLRVPEDSLGPTSLEFDQNMNLLIPTANGLWRVER